MLEKIWNWVKIAWSWLTANSNTIFIILCFVTAILLLFLIFSFREFVKQEENIKRMMIIEEHEFASNHDEIVLDHHSNDEVMNETNIWK